MNRGTSVAAVISLLGCAGPRPVSEAPGESVVPLTAPNADHIDSLDNAASDAEAQEPASDDAESLSSVPMVEHDYRLVFEGWAFALFLEAQPYLITTDGAVNLATGTVDFERDGSNWTAHRGDSLWFGDRFSPMSACPEPSTLVQRVGAKWVPRFEMNVHSLIVQPWVKGSSLAAIVPLRSGPPWGYELTVLERNRTPPRPARRGPHHLPECETRIAWLQTLVAFPSGEIFAFGSECGQQPLPEQEPPLPDESNATGSGETFEAADPDRPELPPNVMESWHNGGHEFIEVPLREVGQVIGVGPKDLWAVGTRDDESWAVAHFDGVAWQVLPGYYDHGIATLRVFDGETGRDARRVILTSQQLLEINNGVTTQHELPAGCRPSDVTLDGEELWISCSSDSETSLHTTRKDIAEVRFDTQAGDRKLVSFTDKPHPRLDPKAPSLRACDSRELLPPGREPGAIPLP